MFARIAEARPDLDARLRRRRRVLSLWRARRGGAGRAGRGGDGRTHRPLRARSRGDRLQHRLDAGAAPAAGRAIPTLPFVGTVPAIKPAAEASKSRLISVLATPGTVARDYTHALVRDFAGDCEVTLVGAPKLAALAERFLRGEPIDDAESRARDRALFRRAGGPPHRPDRARLHAFSAAARAFAAARALAGRLSSIRRRRSPAGSTRCSARAQRLSPRRAGLSRRSSRAARPPSPALQKALRRLGLTATSAGDAPSTADP